MAGTAFAFSRPQSAMRLGHVAWGYTRSVAGGTVYTFGSVEDSKAYPIAKPEAMEFWQESAPEHELARLVALVRRLRYRHFKVWPVPNADPDAADAAALAVSRSTYTIVANNCLDSVHHVLTAYGATDFHLGDLKLPTSWIPNAWFGSIPEEARPLDQLITLMGSLPGEAAEAPPQRPGVPVESS